MLTVRDIMQRDVTTAQPDMTVRELAKMLDGHEISGAPVCDAGGRVVGVVSATDLVRLTAQEPDDSDVGEPRELEGPPEEAEEDNDAAAWYYYLSHEAPELYAGLPAELSEEAYDEFTVRDIMTPTIYAVRPEATLPELARFLLRASIHRALVMEGERLVGIATASDVLRAVAEEVVMEEVVHA